MNRPNLDVLLHAQVSRVLPQTSDSNTLQFNTVEFAIYGSTGAAQTLYKVTAQSDIVLSAGSIGTPQILMNSGIGDSGELKHFGIKTLVDLPSVGRNLTDHPIGIVQYAANSTDTYDKLNNETFFEEQVQDWNQTHKGIMTGSVANTLGFLRLPANSSIFEQTSDPASGPGAAHIEIIFHVSGLIHVSRLCFTDMAQNSYIGPEPAPAGNYFSMSTVVITPMSRKTQFLYLNFLLLIFIFQRR